MRQTTPVCFQPILLLALWEQYQTMPWGSAERVPTSVAAALILPFAQVALPVTTLPMGAASRTTSVQLVSDTIQESAVLPVPNTVQTAPLHQPAPPV